MFLDLFWDGNGGLPLYYQCVTACECGRERRNPGFRYWVHRGGKMAGMQILCLICTLPLIVSIPSSMHPLTLRSTLYTTCYLLIFKLFIGEWFFVSSNIYLLMRMIFCFKQYIFALKYACDQQWSHYQSIHNFAKYVMVV